MSDPTKPALPESYVTPKVWTVPTTNAAFGGMNKPTAGARHNKPLSKGAHPLQLYSLGTPNGQKVTILLEELSVDYDAWRINIMGEQGDQFSEEFTKVNPNQKIPALLDYSVDQNKPLRIFESGSILLYLADKYKRFIPQDIRGRTECISWVFW
jgi:GST-like protein